MANCKLCTGFDDCPFRVGLDTPCWYYKQKPMSNGDRIRAMTDEELAEWLDNNDSYFAIAYTRNEWLDWLKQENKS